MIKGYILFAVLEIIDYFEVYQLFETDSIKFIFRTDIQKSKFISKVMEILDQVINCIDHNSKFSGSSFMKK